MYTDELDNQLQKIEYIGLQKAAATASKNTQVVLSDLVTAEFRERKPDPEFPISLDSLGFFLHRRGYWHTDYTFLPSLETQQNMRRRGQTLLTLGVRQQVRYPVKNADLWGINMMNYLQTPAFFSLLALAGIPALRAERGANHPLIVLGGHIWPNPLPLAHFYDVMVVGDGEEVLCKMAGLAANFKGRKDALLTATANLKGTYVPGYTKNAVARAHIDFQHPDYLPGSSYLINRIGAVVLSRGCPHTCAFCNNAFIGGQYRTKPFSQIASHIDHLKLSRAKKVMLIGFVLKF